MTRISKAREQECKERLQELLKPGDTIYTVLRHVSRSGMYRVIDLYVMKDNRPLRISGWAADLLEGYDRNHEGCKAGGCGMDMGFHLVYSLSYQLFHDGFDCIGKDCNANDHFNGVKASHHRDGGYALRQEWM